LKFFSDGSFGGGWGGGGTGAPGLPAYCPGPRGRSAIRGEAVQLSRGPAARRLADQHVDLARLRPQTTLPGPLGEGVVDDRAGWLPDQQRGEAEARVEHLALARVKYHAGRRGRGDADAMARPSPGPRLPGSSPPVRSGEAYQSAGLTHLHENASNVNTVQSMS